jgi:type III secretion protein T
MSALDSFGNTALALALSLPRIVAAFLVLPLLNGQNMPGLVRNSFFVSLAFIVYPVAAAGAPMQAMGFALWPLIVVKELFIGLMFGFVFSSGFWAVSAAGNLIDTKVGTNFAAVLDPIQGHQTSLTGELLTQLVAWLFMAGGAFSLFIELLMNSYQLWPVTEALPRLREAGSELVTGEFASIMSATLMLAAPALIVMSLIDLSLGLINRYAQQLNVFSLTLPIKAWVATWMVLLSLGTMLDVVTRQLFHNRGLLHVLDKVFR